ncbi:MAG: helix-turn-helix domain-containing protein [Synechococcus sp.]|nr:helix-turn-helix domain-containing protein [Synechococcus sp.]
MKDALLPPLFAAPALTPVLDSRDFDQWKLVIQGALGDHRSALRSPSSSFRSRVAVGQAGPLQLLYLQGQGQMELHRIQDADKAVLWLPLQGWSQERINGQWETAEHGDALLMRPGDRLEGITSLRLEGLSIVLPPDHLQSNSPAHIGAGRHNRALVRAALGFAKAIALGRAGAEHAALELLDALQSRELQTALLQGEPRERITTVRRRAYVEQASQWMGLHLDEAIDIRRIATAIGVSTRTLQYAFLDDRGHSPMAELKRLRLRHLRQLLLDPEQRQHSTAELLVRAGLLACGATAADYRRYCGESPRETRQQSAQ